MNGYEDWSPIDQYQSREPINPIVGSYAGESSTEWIPPSWAPSRFTQSHLYAYGLGMVSAIAIYYTYKYYLKGKIAERFGG